MVDLTNVPSGGGTYRVNLHYGIGNNTATDVYFNYAASNYFNDTRFVLDNTTECTYWVDWYSYPPVVASVIVPNNGTLSIYYGNYGAAAGTSDVLDIHTLTMIEGFESTAGWSISHWGLGACGTPSMTLRDNWYTQGAWSILFTGNCPGAADHCNVYTKPLSVQNVHYVLVDYYGNHAGGYSYLMCGGTIAHDCNGARYDVRKTVLSDISSVAVAVGVANGGSGGDYVYVDDLRAYCYKKPYTIITTSFTEEQRADVHVTDYAPSPIPVLYENDTQTFNVTLAWLVDPSCKRSYTNTSLKQGYWNFTMSAVTANSNTSFTWMFPVHPPTVWITNMTPTYHPTHYEDQPATFAVNLTWNGTENVQTKWYIANASDPVNKTLVYTNPETTTDFREYTNASMKRGSYIFTANATPMGINPVSSNVTWNVTVQAAAFVPDGYATIQAAVNAFCAAGTDDVIVVRDGTYTENIILPGGCDNISIVSENGSATTTIKAASGANPVIAMSSNNNTLIQGFTIKEGLYGITVDSGSSHTTLTDNIITTNFNTGLYIVGSHANLTTINNTCSYNQDGVMLYNAADLTINDTICTYNSDDGIHIQGCDHVTISDCSATYNANNGIELTGSSDFNVIRNNTLEYNNDYGLAIAAGSDYNKIYNNEFHNGVNTYDESLNVWYTTLTESINIIGGQYIGGNSYSDYDGADADHDGIGDEPYLISGGSNKDMLPLTGLGYWVAFDRPTYLIGETLLMNYHLTEGEAAFGTYNYFVEVRDDQNALRGTWSITYGEETGSYTKELKLGWRTGEYTVYLWRTPKAGGGEVLLDYDTATIGIYMEITGTVYDVQNNVTLSDVDVVFNQLGTMFTDTTAADGTYELSGLEIDKNTAVSATKTGYDHEDFMVTILAEQVYTVDLYMLPEEPYRNGSAIGGVITSHPFHQAIEGATVNLYNTTWNDVQSTDWLGFYTFEQLTGGTYTIAAAKIGHSTHTPENVTV
ncbi:MAG: hypothetical protein BA864_15470 [Desulfuromonadales bacterium C00003093]|nr:MAG: hypothetical protein BA864_15470 [Desulfuromonadales bacterium C00003093]